MMMRILSLALVILPASALAAHAADVPGDRSTRAVVEVGRDRTEGAFERSTDSDWYRVQLEAGRTYAVDSFLLGSPEWA